MCRHLSYNNLRLCRFRFIFRNAIVVLSLLTFACASQRGVAQTRIDYALTFATKQIDNIETVHADNPRTFWIRMQKQLIVSLKAANERTLREPVIASAGFNKKEDGVRFFLLWLEDLPTIDAIELSVGTDKATTIALDDYTIKSNQDDALQSVRFSFIVLLKPDSQLSKSLLASWGKDDVRCTVIRKTKRLATTKTFIWDEIP